MISVKHRVKRLLSLTFVAMLLSVFLLQFVSVSSPSYAQEGQKDAQTLSIDLYTALRQSGRPEGIAVRLQKAIQHFRFKCIRVKEYQVYSAQPNMIILKVGCISSPAYGVSVAANGYLSIYGGNGILEPMSEEDGRVFAFNADGSLQPFVAPEFKHYVNKAAEKAKLGTLESKFYLSLLFPIIGVIVLMGLYMWLRSWKRMRYSTAYNQYLPSALKDELITESTVVADSIYKHPSGFYIARGKRGKRRLFNRYFQAWMYRSLAMKFGEISYLPSNEVNADDEDEDY